MRERGLLGAYKIAVNDAGRVYVFKPTLSGRDKRLTKAIEDDTTHQNLIQKVLNELLL